MDTEVASTRRDGPPGSRAASLLGRVPSQDFPYRVEAKVGEGSMGVVYRACEAALERPVAVKVLKTSALGAGDDAAVAREMCLRFLQEARSAAAIQHPAAVTIYRSGEVDRAPFIAMEWLEGENLAARLARVGRLEIEAAVDLALQILAGLQAAHDAGVVHRDIKPANLMMLPDGRVKVTDFGIARFQRGHLLETQAGVILGTPSYASPEQLRGDDVDGRSDLFSLGAVLYQALTGRLPFPAASFLELVPKLLGDARPEPPSALCPEIPEALERIVSRALAKDRSQRWSSAREMAHALASLRRAPTVIESVPPDEPPKRDATSTLVVAGAQSYPVYRGVPTQLSSAVAHLVCTWPAKNLAPQPVEDLLVRLLDKPLHAPAFSGGVVLGDLVLLLHDSRILGAVDRKRGVSGASVIEHLPIQSSAQLHALPENLPPGTMAVLAGLLGTSSVRQRGLDASIVDFVGLANRLQEEGFDGFLHVQREGEEGRIVLVDGRTVLAFYSSAWPEALLARTWTSWAGDQASRLDIEEVSPRTLDLTWKVRLRDLVLACHHESASQRSRSSSSIVARRLRSLASRLAPPPPRVTLSLTRQPAPEAEGWQGDPAVELLQWLLNEAPARFAEERLSARWKYLLEWLGEVSTARLHYRLRAADVGTPRFDVATFDAAGKLLHLAHRFPEMTPTKFRLSLQAALAEKEARRDGGDLGAVVLVAPEFPPEVIALYFESIEEKASGLARLQENLTGYAGFVRLGARRGFHLLLVEEREGKLSPLGI